MSPLRVSLLDAECSGLRNELIRQRVAPVAYACVNEPLGLDDRGSEPGCDAGCEAGPALYACPQMPCAARRYQQQTCCQCDSAIRVGEPY
jgi:hypothetical protein